MTTTLAIHSGGLFPRNILPPAAAAAGDGGIHRDEVTAVKFCVKGSRHLSPSALPATSQLSSRGNPLSDTEPEVVRGNIGQSSSSRRTMND